MRFESGTSASSAMLGLLYAGRAACSIRSSDTARDAMTDIERISPQQAYAKVRSKQALLVCAYEDEAKCRRLDLEGSISFTSFKSRVQSLPKSQEIIFY
jgi:hypothetical protein